MKHIAILISFCCFFFSTEAAKITSKKEQKFQQFMQALSSVKHYIQLNTKNQTIEGFQTYMGRKLTPKEKKIFRMYKATDPATPEEEADMLHNKRLATWSMIMGIAGFVFLFIPYLGILSPFLFPAALITGIIALNRAGKNENQKQSGFGQALAGTILGGVGILLGFLAVIVLLLSL